MPAPSLMKLMTVPSATGCQSIKRMHGGVRGRAIPIPALDIEGAEGQGETILGRPARGYGEVGGLGNNCESSAKLALTQTR